MCLQSEKRSSNFMYLMVEFPRVKTNDKEYSIVYYEKVFPHLHAPNIHKEGGACQLCLSLAGSNILEKSFYLCKCVHIP